MALPVCCSLFRKKIKIKKRPIPEQNVRLIILGDGEMRERESEHPYRPGFGYLFIFWLVVGKVAGKKKNKKKNGGKVYF